MDFSNLIKLDRLSPIEKYSYLCENGIVNNKMLCDNILLALKALDAVIASDLNGRCFLYLQDEASVKWVIEKDLGSSYDSEEFEECLYFIDFSKLVYRFTCAKKFMVNDSAINQLRINSWGIVYLNMLNDELHNDQYTRYFNIFKKYYDENREKYLNLENLVSKPITASSAKEIQNINEGLNVKILS